MDAFGQRLGASGFHHRQPVGEHGGEDFHHLPIAVVGPGELASHAFQRRRQHPVLERSAITQLFVKPVIIEGKRDVVCRNEAEAEKDRQDREAIVAALDTQLKKGDKALIGNSACRRYLRKSAGSEDTRAFQIDAGKLAEEARFDGIFVLRPNGPTPFASLSAQMITLLVKAGSTSLAIPPADNAA